MYGRSELLLLRFSCTGEGGSDVDGRRRRGLSDVREGGSVVYGRVAVIGCTLVCMGELRCPSAMQIAVVPSLQITVADSLCRGVLRSGRFGVPVEIPCGCRSFKVWWR